MKTLLVSATYEELKPLFEKAEKINQIDDKLNTYQIGSKEFDLLCTGVGMVATSFHLGRVLASYKYDRVINAGIAGSFDKDIPLGSVVEVIEDQFPEMGAEDGAIFLSMLDLELIEADEFPYQSGVLSNEQEIWSLTYPKVKSKVDRPILYFAINGLDYIMTKEENGTIKLFNRRGVERYKVNNNL